MSSIAHFYPYRYSLPAPPSTAMSPTGGRGKLSRPSEWILEWWNDGMMEYWDFGMMERVGQALKGGFHDHGGF